MITRIFIAALLLLQLSSAQRLSHPLHAAPPSPMHRSAAAAFPDTVKVLAILVQFQSDTDPRTSGNGHFDLDTTDQRIIDPPPHDSAYVADHFRFAQNYFSKSSNGQQHVSATVLGKVITLGKQMKDYAPLNGNLPLANMIEEAWKAADTLYNPFPFEEYDMFAVVHAGVGRDIDMRSILGFDPTPLDLPSLYFSLQAFQKLFGSSYQGVTLKNSPFKIPNTVVLPETEVRKIPGIGTEIVLELGINGLLAASIGSHLGLPDLFDTKTGKSGIGRFGLMDGQSMFSFYGIAPPEPSAWEKVFLGWTTPIELTGTSTVSVPAVGLHSAGRDTIYKVPISAKEYYLIENRHRDANGGGDTVTVRWKGITEKHVFTQDRTNFSNNSIDSLYGVVLDVDEPDWSLPGLVNDFNAYHGGILIWHIDETVIEKNLAGNSVNADPEKRGVDLEEADGSQDIGQSYGFGDAASGTEDGSPIDYWFSGNIFPSYKNEFSENTLPNTLTNTFARSHITIKNFSLQGPRMSFEARIGSADIQLVKTIKRANLKQNNNDAPITADINGDGVKEFVFTSGDSIYVLKNDLTPFLNNSTGLFSPAGGRFQPATLRILSRSENVLAGVQGNRMYVFSSADANNDGIADLLHSAVSLSPFSTPVSAYTSQQNGYSYFIAGDSSGRRMRYINTAAASWTSDSVQYFRSPVFGVSLSDTAMTYSLDSVALLSSLHNFGGRSLLAFTSRGSGENYALFSDHTFGQFDATAASSSLRSYRLNIAAAGSFALYDVNRDGDLDFLIGGGDKLYAYSRNGVLIENFPFKTLDGGMVKGSPVIARKKNADEILIFFGSSNGHLYAIDENAKIAPGFPLQTGGIVSSPLLWNDYLSVASTDSSVYQWKITGLVDTSLIYWKGFLVDHSHSNMPMVTATIQKKSTEFLPKKFAYNWPNPVYSGSTFIRYFLGNPGTVTIKIVNMAGELVEELKGTEFAGMDNEVEWDISKVQSGIYFAQITASGGGEEMSQIVKIAVVK